MRNLLWLCLLFTFSGLAAALPGDDRLKQMASSLPPGWAMSLEGHRLEFFRKEEVYILTENRINAPAALGSGDRVRRLGKRGRCRVEYRLEEKWTAPRRAEAERTNEGIYDAEKGLPAKHHIEHLRDKRLSRKGGPVYTGHTPQESRAIEAFEQERTLLRQGLVTLPDHESSLYSIFRVALEGQDDEMHLVDPPQASRELSQVLQRMDEVCKVP